MTEQEFEQAIEQSAESFADWAWPYELLIGGIIFIVLLIIGMTLIKKKKNNAGYICIGISIIVLFSDVIKALFRMT